MKYEKFTFTSDIFAITHERKTYGKTASGKSWCKQPHEEISENVLPQFYENFVRSIPFFNGFFGGSCRAEWGYTGAGYLPIKITTTSPDGSTKHIDRFYFEYIGR